MNGTDSFLLDTNVVIGFLNGDANIRDFFEKKLMRSLLHVSQITRMELLGFPGISSEEETELKKFLSRIQVLPINDAVCDQAINLRKLTCVN
ncbi:MAG: PIN domain-containing protein [Gammaproteobacteria bacterium]|nr:PIN domain-containing protein [Gammaproteobacteria bacterium]